MAERTLHPSPWWATLGLATLGLATLAGLAACEPGGETSDDDGSPAADDDATAADDDTAGDDDTTADDDTPTGDDTSGDDDTAANSDADCLTDAEEAELGTDPLLADTDGDGLDDCVEDRETRTNPVVDDSDGDGDLDGEEVECVSDPWDAAEVCYACGWGHNDPGTLVSTGAEVGDVIANLPLWDECNEQVDLWDFAGEYHILFGSTGW